MADEKDGKEERDYKGTKFDMKLIGSGWIKETRGKRKFQRFVINEGVELQDKDVLCVFLAKTKKNENSPGYYLFLDTNARERKKKRDRAADPPNEERVPKDDDDRDSDDADAF